MYELWKHNTWVCCMASSTSHSRRTKACIITYIIKQVFGVLLGLDIEVFMMILYLFLLAPRVRVIRVRSRRSCVHVLACVHVDDMCVHVCACVCVHVCAARVCL